MNRLLMIILLAMSFNSSSKETCEDYGISCLFVDFTMSGNEYSEDGYPYYYYLGVHHALDIYDYLRVGTKEFDCQPEGVTNDQTHKILIKYIKENPDKTHKGVKELIILSKQEAFPCED